ncbi:DUF6241 domain-containing protein [Jeotgalibacillus marinus]|uniref:DUF6241 domain-containing protein n=1 Tax=Jeotgalibacillus marinus TaxID=86667 RepID=A0ABV3Q6N2_9BACL
MLKKFLSKFTVKVIAVTTLTIAVGTGAGAFLLTKTNFPEGKTDEEKRAENIVKQTDNSELQEALAVINDDADDTVIEDEVSDFAVQNVIHGMSHQKVKADQKWGGTNVLMTEKRVEVLHKQVIDHAETLEFYAEYKEILDRWVAGDFSLADIDHNIIWGLRGGTIGKATRLLSDEEEYAYILSKYKDELMEIESLEIDL